MVVLTRDSHSLWTCVTIHGVEDNRIGDITMLTRYLASQFGLKFWASVISHCPYDICCINTRGGVVVTDGVGIVVLITTMYVGLGP